MNLSDAIREEFPDKLLVLKIRSELIVRYVESHDIEGARLPFARGTLTRASRGGEL
jgi:hypothetical protein